jgi:hypothetical protein
MIWGRRFNPTKADVFLVGIAVRVPVVDFPTVARVVTITLFERFGVSFPSEISSFLD